MTRLLYCRRARLALCAIALLLGAGLSPPGARAQDPLDLLYARIAADLGRGDPLRIRIYVALCDNDSQGIVPVKNRAICDGDDAARNIYWGTSGGLSGYLARKGWRRMPTDSDAVPSNGAVAVHAHWRGRRWVGRRLRSLAPGIPRRVDVQIEALAYRGAAIRDAMADYIADVHSVHSDDAAPHVIGYMGHNYLLDTDEPLIPPPASNPAEPAPVGVFALSCFGHQSIRPSITRAGAAILLLNRGLTYPGAWTVDGLVEGLSRGADARRLHRIAAKHFARGKGRPARSMMGLFAHGDDP